MIIFSAKSKQIKIYYNIKSLFTQKLNLINFKNKKLLIIH